MIGRVVSTKMYNTVVVLVERVAMHPLYKKTFIRSKKYLVDAGENIKDGDVVEIVKVKPISKNKHWKVVRVVGKNLVEITTSQLKAEAKKLVAEVMPVEKEELKGESIKDEEVKIKETEEKNKKTRKDRNGST